MDSPHATSVRRFVANLCEQYAIRGARGLAPLDNSPLCFSLRIRAPPCPREGLRPPETGILATERRERRTLAKRNERGGVQGSPPHGARMERRERRNARE